MNLRTKLADVLVNISHINNICVCVMMLCANTRYARKHFFIGHNESTSYFTLNGLSFIYFFPIISHLFLRQINECYQVISDRICSHADAFGEIP